MTQSLQSIGAPFPVTGPLRAYDAFLGDPADPSAPISFADTLDADRSEDFPDHIIAALNAWGLAAYCIPADIQGGRMSRFDIPLFLIRATSRRCLTTTIAFWKTLLGAGPVLLAGSQEQKTRIGRLVLSGQPISLGLTEEAHGSDLIASDTIVTETVSGTFELTGRKWLINNASRSAAIVVYCNQGDQRQARAGRFVILEKSRAPDACTPLAKIRTKGVRFADISGLEIRGFPINEDDILAGPPGFEVLLTTLQPSRIQCGGISLGSAELLIRAWLEHRQDGDAAIFVQVVSSYLICDVLVTAAARSVHLAPRQAAFLSAVVKYLVPEAVEQMYGMVTPLFGPGLLAEGGPLAHVEKAERDQSVIGFFDGNSVINLQQLHMQLPQVLRRQERLRRGLGSDLAEIAAAGDRLRSAVAADANVDLPALDLGGLRSTSGGHSDLFVSLTFRCSLFPELNDWLDLAAELEHLANEWRALADRISDLVDARLAPADPLWFAVAETTAPLVARAFFAFAALFRAAEDGGRSLPLGLLVLRNARDLPTTEAEAEALTRDLTERARTQPIISMFLEAEG